MEFTSKIEGILEKLKQNLSDWSREERAVMRLLQKNFREGDGKITQVQIAEDEQWLGCHPKYEKYGSNATTLRKVRQVIRDLRVERGAPILSDEDGYWIPKTREEVNEYMVRMERTAKAQAAAWFETWRAIDKVVGVKSEYFEAQVPLIETENEN